MFHKHICLSSFLVLFFSLSLLACSPDDENNPDDTTDLNTDASANNTNSNNTNNTQSGDFTLTSELVSEGGILPESLKCERDGGTGDAPPIAWSGAPDGTTSYAVIMHHYPDMADPTVDDPSHYWLLWNIDAGVTGIAQGNPDSIGEEGSDKDGVATGYTPPCSPPGSAHTYTITVYALSEAPTLGDSDDLSVDWSALTNAISGSTLASSSLSFTN